MKTSVPYEQIFATFSPARQRKIKHRAAELIAEEFTHRSASPVARIERHLLRTRHAQ